MGGAVSASAANLRLPKRRLDNQAADVLREQILSGRFAPGLRLVEASLADQLGVSRGTVRAALSELAHEGLVSQVAYTKWMVPEFSAGDAWELYSLRGSLEGLAARLATDRRTPETMKTLQDAYERLEAAVAAERRSAVAAADLALHKTIVAITGHRRLIGQYKLIEQQVRHYIATSNAEVLDQHELLDQHQPIVQAIVAGDAARAERLAHDHNAPEVERFAAELARANERQGEILPLPARPRRGASPTEKSDQGGKK
jgi:DNA-binding GntR family transcriptional regulator